MALNVDWTHSIHAGMHFEDKNVNTVVCCHAWRIGPLPLFSWLLDHNVELNTLLIPPEHISFVERAGHLPPILLWLVICISAG